MGRWFFFRLQIVLARPLQQREKPLCREDVIEAGLANPPHPAGPPRIKRRGFDAERTPTEPFGDPRSFARGGSGMSPDKDEICHAQIREDKLEVGRREHAHGLAVMIGRASRAGAQRAGSAHDTRLRRRAQLGKPLFGAFLPLRRGEAVAARSASRSIKGRDECGDGPALPRARLRVEVGSGSRQAGM